MKSRCIHVVGASGSGATSLGRALAGALALPHHDADDYLWLPTVPPYRTLRDAAERLRLMREMFLPRADWVLSGDISGWGDAIIPQFDLAIFLTAPHDDAAIDAAIIAYVSTFVPKMSGEHFNPHVSTGVAPREYLDKMLTEPFDTFMFSPAGAAIYQLGPFGTAAKPLKEWN